MGKLDGSKLDGREIRIQMARYARPENGRGGGRDRDRDRDDFHSRGGDDRRYRDDYDDRSVQTFNSDRDSGSLPDRP